jgi:cell division septation protein DedD
MENRLKERLTGAAILVALIVMLVPEMFRGQRGGDAANPTAGGTSGTDGPPVRSYTIDLSNNPKSSGPLQSTTESQLVAPAPTGASAPAMAPAIAPVAPPPAPAPAPVSVPTAKPTPPQPQTPGHTPNAARVAHSTPAGAPAAAPKAANAGPWSVQLGIFSKRENAERLVSDAKVKGFNVGVSSADSKGLFHVRTAGLPDRTAAQTLAQRLKADGFQAAVVAP